ncbi:DUF2913 family protein [Vibrio tapetis]|uniref:DUF2913 domain-containing protein n=1 Tax=Vibrio tapetis subsp. tapetis TaxID=1671868 RepID=A0A2N8ZI23_9VIBR|nr:DUF2913 family protein [Vibrio tapetis]SON51563.1 conserved protein of unknown function [Vibrio tapetis subsp. tapetis]
MQIKRDFNYYHHLHDTVTHALLHLFFQISTTTRYVPVNRRNEILIKYLKPKLSDTSLSSIKKDIKLMVNSARKSGGNLEMKLHELNALAKQSKLKGAEKLYHLLVCLYDEEGLESRLFEKGMQTKPGILYLLEEQLEQGFDAEHRQVSPISMLIELERAPELIECINRHGLFVAEMKEWNEKTHQAHLLVHPLDINLIEG